MTATILGISIFATLAIAFCFMIRDTFAGWAHDAELNDTFEKERANIPQVDPL